eukprot:364436-Chlamydomonas_euryale.AAC.4
MARWRWNCASAGRERFFCVVPAGQGMSAVHSARSGAWYRCACMAPPAWGSGFRVKPSTWGGPGRWQWAERARGGRLPV